MVETEIFTALNEIFIEKKITSILIYEMTKVCSLTVKDLNWNLNRSKWDFHTKEWTDITILIYEMTKARSLHNESFLNEVISQMYVHWQWNDGNEILTARNEVFIEKNEQTQLSKYTKGQKHVHCTMKCLKLKS
jgi:hypothetical protein